MKFVLVSSLFFASISVFAYAPDFSPKERVAIQATIDQAKKETESNCDHEDLKEVEDGYNVQVYCEGIQDFIWYFVKVTVDDQDKSLIPSAPVRLNSMDDRAE